MKEQVRKQIEKLDMKMMFVKGLIVGVILMGIIQILIFQLNR